MKLLTKNGYKFATGLFWQIPDENKRIINFTKLRRDTKHSMYCQIKNIKPTWGFCRKEDLHLEKKVAALAKFIVESSNLTADYANSIICYKFKSAGETDEAGKILKKDLFGYIVLLNGTICPEDGEYVSEFEAVRESIIIKAKKHEIETLYLPLDVSGKFFSLFERLFDAIHSDELLIQIMQNISVVDAGLFNTTIDVQFKDKYKALVTNKLQITDLMLLKQLIKEPEFEKIFKDTRDLTIKYLIPNVYHLHYTSDQIYWQQNKFKQRCKSALMRPLTSIRINKIKTGILLLVFGVISYIAYTYLLPQQKKLEKRLITPKPIVVQLVNVLPGELILACIAKNDRYFNPSGNWLLVNLKCNSNGAILTFNTDYDSTIDSFIQFTQNANQSKLSGRVGVLVQPYHLSAASLHKQLSKDKIISQLQQDAINYKLSLTILGNDSKQSTVKFVLTSSLSPIFLFTHGVLANVGLREISMNLNKTTGFYSWSLQGEVR